MTKRIHNFSAGPSALPLPVLERARDEFIDFRGSGMSIIEMSHRSKPYDDIHNGAIAGLRKLLGLSDDFAVLFMGGGARSQFATLAMNLLGDGCADYVNTGSWAGHAFKQAKKLGDARELWSSKESQHNHVPQAGDLKCSPGARYVHTTSNNTICGTQYQYTPDFGDTPHICDMSSDILSRTIDGDKYGLIYAGAQKNMGPAGVTVVILRKDVLERCSSDVPDMFNYKLLAEKNSLLNTPPVFPIYMLNLVTSHLLDLGGLPAVAEANESKAQALYKAIDESDGFYKPHAQHDSRSRMNVTFRLPSEDLEKQFLAEAPSADLSGLKGHRSVGGLRASIYNAVPRESVDALIEFMTEFMGAARSKAG